MHNGTDTTSSEHRLPSARWMTSLAFHRGGCGDIATASFVDIPLVGTHDSATHGICDASDFAADAPGALSKLPRAMVPTVRRIVADWSKTQSAGLLEQLESGVRYFDIRLVPRRRAEKADQPDELWVSHGSYSVPFESVVHEIAIFYSSVLNGHAEENLETIVIDVQRVTSFTPAHTALFMRAIAPLQPLLVPADLHVSTQLRDVWRSPAGLGVSKRRIFLLFPVEAAEMAESIVSAEDAALLHDRHHESIRSVWFNQQTVPPLLRMLQCELLFAGGASCERSGTLHVLQAVLTPRPIEIASSIFRVGRHATILDYARSLNDHVLALWQAFGALAQWAPRGSACEGAIRDRRNVLMLDFYQIGRTPSGASAVEVCWQDALRRFAPSALGGVPVAAPREAVHIVQEDETLTETAVA